MRFAPLLFIAAFSFNALAQTTEQAPDAVESKVAVTEKSPWKFGVDLGATTSWSVNQKFVGVTDGHYLAWGGKITGTANFIEGVHEWRNTLSLLETFNKTPLIGEILKSADQLSLESLYLWSFGQWWGAFAQLNFDTSLFVGQDVRPTSVTYEITDVAGAKSTLASDRLRLTDPFLPFYLKQSLGLFAKPIQEEPFSWEIKAGATARETFARNQKIVTGQTGGTVNVDTLADFYQIGPSAGTLIHGEVMSKKVSYKAGVDVMYVAFRSSLKPIGTEWSDRINFEALAALSFKLVDWAALTWDFKAIRLPDITRDFQIQSNVLLTLSYTI